MLFVFVQGPTASGKSNIALELALHFGQSCIVNCDSIQTYSGLKIGSAAPSDADLASVPHYLYGYVNPPDTLTAGQYCRDFFDWCESTIEKTKTYKTVFVVGGTGFYFQAIEKGMYPVEASGRQPALNALRHGLEKELLKENGPDILFAELLAKDPTRAAQIHKNDHYRLVRSLELLRTEKQNVTELSEASRITKKFPYPLVKIGIGFEREVLLARVEERTKIMLQNGLIEETKLFIEKGWGSWAPLQSIGYLETSAYLQGNLATPAALLEKIYIATRQLAKRQMTWFKRDQEVHWFDGQNPEILQNVIAKIEQLRPGV